LKKTPAITKEVKFLSAIQVFVEQYPFFRRTYELTDREVVQPLLTGLDISKNIIAYRSNQLEDEDNVGQIYLYDALERESSGSETEETEDRITDPEN
jgi:hypothetical protein